MFYVELAIGEKWGEVESVKMKLTLGSKLRTCVKYLG